MNPFEPPAAVHRQGEIETSSYRPIGLVIITSMMLCAATLGFISPIFPAIRAVIVPRFGWSGLVMCLTPTVFLLPSCFKPTKTSLLCAAFTTFSIGMINAIPLLFTTTVANVTNEFFDRLHSSWQWAVLPFFLASVYILFLAVQLHIAESSQS